MPDADDVTIEHEEDGASPAAEAKLKKLRDELKEVKKERDEYLAGWQRSKADYVNLSRRVRDEAATSARTNTAKMARATIAVFDSLEAAYKSAVAEHPGSATCTGIEQVMRQLETALKEQGVVRFTPEEGAAFNPEQQEVVATVATESEKEDNTILETFQSGYEIEGVTIRPARVSVKKHG